MPIDPGLPDLDDPNYKQWLRDKGGGGRGPIPGGGGLGGGGGGFSFGRSTVAPSFSSTGSGDVLRDVLRRRLRMPGQAAPNYLTSGTGVSAPGDSASAATTFGVANKGTAMPSINIRQLGGRAPSLGGPSLMPGTSGIGGTQAQWTPPKDSPYWGDDSLDLNEWSGAGWDRSRTSNKMYDLLKQYADFGSFSPTGNDGFMDAVRSKALEDAGAARDRNTLLAKQFGLDPASAASFAMRADLQGQGGVSRAMSDATLSRLDSQDRFGKDLFTMLGNANINDWNLSRQADINEKLKRINVGGGGGFDWADLLGSAAGAGLGAFTGGVGTGLAKRIF